MDENEKWKKEFERIVKVIKDYEQDKIKLSKKEASDMWSVLGTLKNKCPHPELVEKHKMDYWEDYSYAGTRSGRTAECKIICAYCNSVIETGKKTFNGTYFAVNPKEHYYHDDGMESFEILLFNDKTRSKIKMERVAYANHCFRWIPQSPPPPSKPPKPEPKPDYLSKLEKLEKTKKASTASS
jgi:hypothetical protein